MINYIIRFTIAGQQFYKAFDSFDEAADRHEQLYDLIDQLDLDRDTFELDHKIESVEVNNAKELAGLLNSVREQPDLDKLDLGLYNLDGPSALN